MGVNKKPYKLSFVSSPTIAFNNISGDGFGGSTKLAADFMEFEFGQAKAKLVNLHPKLMRQLIDLKILI